MFNFIAEKAKAVSGAVESSLKTAGETVISVKDTVVDGVGEGSNVAFSYLEENGESIQRVFVDGLIDVTHDRLKDDEVFEYFAEKTFELLPIAIRLVLPRAAFMKHCLGQRENIIKMIETQQIKLQKKREAEPAKLATSTNPSDPILLE